MNINTSGKQKQHTFTDRLLMAGLVLLCINPGVTQGHSNMNVLLNLALCISPFILVIKQARVFIPRIDVTMLLMILGVAFQPFIFHPESIRWSTMMFTCSYGIFFMMMARLCRISNLRPDQISRLIKWIVYAFAITLIIQQLCVFLGFQVFMRAMVYENPWKLNSLTAEPSHTTLILSLLMYFYVQIQKQAFSGFTLLRSFREAPAMWLCFLYVIMTTDNASAILIGPLCLLPLINKKNWGWYAGAALVMIGLVEILPDTFHTGRVKRTIESIGSLDEAVIIAADESAAGRIVPTLRGARIMTPISMETIIGHGVDADQRDTDPVPGMANSVGHAGIFSMWYNYGLLATLAFWTAIGLVTIIYRKWWSYLTFLIAFFLSGNYNVQFVWMVMTFAMVYKYNICGINSLLSTRRP